ncbi:MAG TPA: cytochrome c-type biogenesis protein [Xanthobacteraceae bacterium]|jgi:cytochrome c-type biogenesis protein CcmH
MTKISRSTRDALIAALLAFLAYAAPACAVTPDEVLKNPVLEMRARAISQNLRCMVCQNESIDDSAAPLAHDIRVLVRQRLTAGDTDEQAVQFIVARYGNFVLLKPPLQLDTLALWSGPALFLLIAAIGFALHLRRQSADQGTLTAPLTAAEQRQVDVLLNERSST